MKKLAFLLGLVFFTTVAFSQNKTDAAKQDQKKQSTKTEQVKPAEKVNTTSQANPAMAKKEPTPVKHSKKHKGTPKKEETPKK
jgi:hypothetical protein